jgi:uncharacterized protein YjbI with pentapeptide repeats
MKQVPVKIMEPVIPKDLPEKNFADCFDPDEPYIEHALFKDTAIDLGDRRGVEFTEVRFQNVTFSEATVPQLYLRDVIFESCDFANVQLDEVTMKRVRFVNCRLIGTSMTEGVFEDVIFRECNLQMAALGFSKQKNVRYENCRLNEADFYTCKLKKVDFSECELSGINFTGTP